MKVSLIEDANPLSGPTQRFRNGFPNNPFSGFPWRSLSGAENFLTFD
jgi:hypothetical protein